MIRKKPVPRELKEGLKPIRIGLLRTDHDEALRRALSERADEVSKKLDILREHYGVEQGPQCWRELTLAMARDRFPGFREKSSRKPSKWTVGTLTMLAGEMRREMDARGGTQEDAAKGLASRDPWKGFLSTGRWARSNSREAWENLLDEYTRMPRRYRETGKATYLASAHLGRLAEWESLVRDFLERPE